MSEQEKKQKFMICQNVVTKPKFSEIIGVSLWPPSSPDHNPLDYAIWGVLENKKNATPPPNIGSLKTVSLQSPLLYKNIPNFASVPYSSI